MTCQVEHVFQRNPKFRSLSASMMQPLTRFVQLEPGVEYRLRAKVPNQDDENSAVYTYFQVCHCTACLGLHCLMRNGMPTSG